MEKKYDIFISYRRKSGSYFASLLKSHLQDKGINADRIFMDTHSMHNTQSFPEYIAQAIEESSNIIVVVSKYSFPNIIEDKDYYIDEIESALKHGKNIVPVFIDGIDSFSTFSMPERVEALKMCNAITYNHEYEDGFIEKLLSFLVGINRDTPISKERHWFQFGLRSKGCTMNITLMSMLSIVVFAGVVGFEKTYRLIKTTPKVEEKINSRDTIEIPESYDEKTTDEDGTICDGMYKSGLTQDNIINGTKKVVSSVESVLEANLSLGTFAISLSDNDSIVDDNSDNAPANYFPLPLSLKKSDIDYFLPDTGAVRYVTMAPTCNIKNVIASTNVQCTKLTENHYKLTFAKCDVDTCVNGLFGVRFEGDSISREVTFTYVPSMKVSSEVKRYGAFQTAVKTLCKFMLDNVLSVDEYSFNYSPNKYWKDIYYANPNILYHSTNYSINSKFFYVGEYLTDTVVSKGVEIVHPDCSQNILGCRNARVFVGTRSGRYKINGVCYDEKGHYLGDYDFSKGQRKPVVFVDPMKKNYRFGLVEYVNGDKYFGEYIRQKTNKSSKIIPIRSGLGCYVWNKSGAFYYGKWSSTNIVSSIQLWQEGFLFWGTKKTECADLTDLLRDLENDVILLED